MSGCSLNNPDSIEDLINLLSRQKNLRKLKLSDKSVNEKFINILPKEYLEVLELDFYDNHSDCSIIKFRKWIVFKTVINELSDNFMKELSNCKNLKELAFSQISNYLLTDTGEEYFSQLSNLEKFKIHVKDKSIDKILIELDKLYNFKKNWHCWM